MVVEEKYSSVAFDWRKDQVKHACPGRSIHERWSRLAVLVVALVLLKLVSFGGSFFYPTVLISIIYQGKAINLWCTKILGSTWKYLAGLNGVWSLSLHKTHLYEGSRIFLCSISRNCPWAKFRRSKNMKMQLKVHVICMDNVWERVTGIIRLGRKNIACLKLRVLVRLIKPSLRPFPVNFMLSFTTWWNWNMNFP